MKSGLGHLNTVDIEKLALVLQAHGLSEDQSESKVQELRPRSETVADRIVKNLTPLLTRQHGTNLQAEIFFMKHLADKKKNF